MKSRMTTCVAAMTLFAASAIPVRLAAQENQNQKLDQHHHYRLIDMGTFGGPQSYVATFGLAAPVLNDRGTVAGWADTSMPDPYPDFCFDEDCFVSHAFRWQDGVLTDLATLPNGASSATNWISASGLIAGVSENGEIDPLIPGFPELRAVLWQHGGIVDLGTLPGGNESLAQSVNSRGRVVGLATNAVADPFSLFGPTEARAFLWQNGLMQDLGTLGGSDAFALLVNERGQVAGDSYTSSTPTQAFLCTDNGFLLTTGAFVWQNGRMVNVGSLGGGCTLAQNLNNRGQVVGASDLAGDSTQHPFLWDRGTLTDLGTLGGDVASGTGLNEAGEVTGFSRIEGNQAYHGYLWRNGRMTDLGTVDGDLCSYGFSINSNDQIVGSSDPTCNLTPLTFRAFLWERGGPMVDLNALVPPGSALHLAWPETINERGEIAGIGVLSNGNEHAFLLIPCDENHPGLEGCDYTMVQGSAAIGVSSASAMPTPTSANQSPVLRGVANPMLRPFGRRLMPGYRGMGAQPQK